MLLSCATASQTLKFNLTFYLSLFPSSQRLPCPGFHEKACLGDRVDWKRGKESRENINNIGAASEGHVDSRLRMRKKQYPTMYNSEAVEQQD